VAEWQTVAYGGRKKADEALAAALAAGQTFRAAATAAGIAERTAARRWADAGFRQRVAELQREMVGRCLGRMADGMAEAADTLRQLLKAESESVRLGAARALVELGVKIRDAVELSERVAELERLAAAHARDRARDCPPSQVSWFELDAIAQRDPNRALERWEEVKRAARGEVATGQRAARALEGYDSHCWSRARFLAVRAELTAAWRPRTAVEQHLIDQLAQWQSLTWYWLEKATAYSEMESTGARRPPSPTGPPDLPRLDRVAAVDRAVQMTDRFHRLYLRTLRALQDLRRLRPVVVRAGGQVNIGHQQVNVGGAPGG
jgi:hypothetical protein